MADDAPIRLTGKRAKGAAMPRETLVLHGYEELSNARYALFEFVPCAEVHAFSRCGHWTQIVQTETADDLGSNSMQQ